MSHNRVTRKGRASVVLAVSSAAILTALALSPVQTAPAGQAPQQKPAPTTQKPATATQKPAVAAATFVGSAFTTFPGRTWEDFRRALTSVFPFVNALKVARRRLQPSR